jgi:hypothetical protein
MKKCISIVCFFLIWLASGARQDLRDSVYEKPKVLCSLFLNTAAGLQMYPLPYDTYYRRTKSTSQVLTFPLDIRFYFFKNHLGIGYTRFTTVGSNHGYEPYNPFMVLHKGRLFRDDEMFYMSYNFNLKPFESRKLSPYFQISSGYSSLAPLLVFGTAGVQYKLTDVIALNLSFNGGGGPGRIRKFDMNFGLCIRALKGKSKPKVEHTRDSLKFIRRFAVEVGAGYHNAESQTLNFYNQASLVDTTDYYHNDLKVLRHALPIIGITFTKGEQSLQLEYSRVNYKDSKTITSSSFIDIKESTSDSYCIDRLSSE